MGDQGVILVGVGIYLVAMLAIGAYAARHSKTSLDFILAGRGLSLPIASASLLATWMGAGTIMGAAGAAYTAGVYPTIADPFGAGLCLLIAGMFFVRILRRMRLLTIIDLFEIKYGRHATVIAAVTQLVAFAGWIGAQLVAFGFILHALTGIPEWLGIVLATTIVLAYTTAGGMWAVALTDAVQMVLMMIGLVLLVPAVVGEFGGWDQLAAAVDSASLRFTPAGNGFNEWTHYLSAWFVIGIGSLMINGRHDVTLRRKILREVAQEGRPISIAVRDNNQRVLVPRQRRSVSRRTSLKLKSRRSSLGNPPRGERQAARIGDLHRLARAQLRRIPNVQVQRARRVRPVASRNGRKIRALRIGKGNDTITNVVFAQLGQLGRIRRRGAVRANAVVANYRRTQRHQAKQQKM